MVYLINESNDSSRDRNPVLYYRKKVEVKESNKSKFVDMTLERAAGKDGIETKNTIPAF